MKAVFDTNILIDFLNGEKAALDELAHYDQKLISVITFIEVLVGVKGGSEEEQVRSFLGDFEVKDLSKAIAEKSIALRRQQGLKVPDAIIYATAQVEGSILVSRNTKDFNENWPDIRVPYGL